MRVAVNVQNGVDGNGRAVYRKEIYGESSETKPTESIATGSLFIEVDTGDAYFFSESSNDWIKQ